MNFFQEQAAVALQDVRKMILDYYGANNVPDFVKRFIDEKISLVQTCPRCKHKHAADGLNCGADIGISGRVCECNL